MKYLILLLVFLSSVSNLRSQNVEGCIVDSLGVPINAATIFVDEINQGVLSDRNGRFQLSLKEGNYTFRFERPEYRDTTYNISVVNDISLYQNFVIEKDSLLVNGKLSAHAKNDKANSVMRSCLRKASEYYDAVKHYKADCYINGQMRLSEVSDLMDRASYRLDKIHISELKGQVVSQELYNEIEYNFPNKYKINIDGYLGYLPDYFTEQGAINILKGSIYAPKVGSFISPLNGSAFRFYRFEYEGYYKSADAICHKIKVKPRVNDPELLSGYLYITDNTWTVKYAVLYSSVLGGESALTITYNQMQDDLYLPITYHNHISLNFMGTKGTVEYYSGLKYTELSTEKSEEEDTDFDTSTYAIAPNARKRDDSYWRALRLQPINKDSIKHISKTIDLKKKLSDVSKSLIGKLVVGGYIAGNDSSSTSLRYNGVKMIFRDYNYVDGFWLGNKFDLKVKIGDNKNFEAHPYLYYATARKRMLGGSDMVYDYDLKKKRRIILNLGSRTEDFNNLALSRYQNYFNSLILGRNDNFFYQRDYVSVDNEIYLNPFIKSSVTVGVDRRSGVFNHTHFNILGKDNIKPNIFPDDRFDRTYYSIQLFYSPRSYYSITEAVDMYKNDITPVFNIEYQEGFTSWQVNNSKYRKLKGGVSHNIRLDYFNSVDYKVEAGGFINKDKNMHFTDYQHFGASDILLNLNSLFDSFLLLDNYQLQTNKYWVNLFLNYSGKYLLLKHLPFLQGKPFTENLHLKTLFTPESRSYVETGYSISFTRYFGAGAFVSFHNIQGRKFGVRFSFNLRSFNFI